MASRAELTETTATLFMTMASNKSDKVMLLRWGQHMVLKVFEQYDQDTAKCKGKTVALIFAKSRNQDYRLPDDVNFRQPKAFGTRINTANVTAGNETVLLSYIKYTTDEPTIVQQLACNNVCLTFGAGNSRRTLGNSYYPHTVYRS